MSKFKKGYDPRRNAAGRPKGRIAELREVMGQLSDDGRTVAERLHEIIMDREASRKEVIEAASLWFSYLVGKPEVAVNIEADVTARPALDAGAVLARLPSDVIDAVATALDDAQQPALPAGDTDDD